MIGFLYILVNLGYHSFLDASILHSLLAFWKMKHGLSLEVVPILVYAYLGYFIYGLRDLVVVYACCNYAGFESKAVLVIN